MTRLKALARAIRKIYYIAQDSLFRIIGHATRRPSLREQLIGSDPLSNSKLAAVYVHFDHNGYIHDYVVHQLCELLEAGFRIIFVTNSPVLPELSRARVLPYCWKVLWRFNIGYDFGAYKDGIAALEKLDGLDGLVLMNDSIYGPFWKLKDTLAVVDNSKYDFWGITDSWEQRYHIQSFFLFFFAPVLQSSAFKNFWRRLPYVDDKGWVIRNGEILMTRTLIRARLRGGVLAPYRRVAKRMISRLPNMKAAITQPSDLSAFIAFQKKISTGRAVNPMQYFWDSLILDYRCPFIKRELLKSNPANIPLLSRWSEIIASQSTYDLAMIHAHLASLKALDTKAS